MLAEFAREKIRERVNDPQLADKLCPDYQILTRRLSPETDYLEVFNANQVLLVGVRCDLAIIEAREAQRLGRFPGTAAGQFISCHAHETYDVEGDTGRQSPEACAAQVIDAVGRPATAFARLLERA